MLEQFLNAADGERVSATSFNDLNIRQAERMLLIYAAM